MGERRRGEYRKTAAERFLLENVEQPAGAEGRGSADTHPSVSCCPKPGVPISIRTLLVSSDIIISYASYLAWLVRDTERRREHS
jgi:hypothetical protein